MNPFQDQKTFMLACGQSVGTLNLVQADLYWTLVQEEFGELTHGYLDFRTMARSLGDEHLEELRERFLTDTIDGAIDTVVVLIGLLQSLGIDAEAAWAEVARSNLSKIDQRTGRVIRRADGKILKPEGWKAPILQPLASSALAASTTGEEA